MMGLFCEDKTLLSLKYCYMKGQAKLVNNIITFPFFNFFFKIHSSGTLPYDLIFVTLTTSGFNHIFFYIYSFFVL